MKILWNSNFQSFTGYRKMSVMLMRELANLGVEIEHRQGVECMYEPVRPFKRFTGTAKEAADQFDFCVDALGIPSAFSFSFPAERRALYTWAETVDLPELWKQSASYFKEAWVPSRHMVDILYPHLGGRKKPRVFPLGVNPILFRPGVEPYPFRDRPPFLFGFVGEGMRKNLRHLIAQFCQTFPGKDKEVGLVILSRDSYRWRDMLGGMTEEMNKNVTFIDRPIPDSMMPSFYSALDCYVTASLGEGWDLPLTEAMACGVPPVAVRNTAHLDYLKDSNAFLIEPEDTVLASSLGDDNFDPVDEFDAVPRDRIGHMMKVAYTQPNERAKKAKLALKVGVKYTWEKTANMIHKRIREILE